MREYQIVLQRWNTDALWEAHVQDDGMPVLDSQGRDALPIIGCGRTKPEAIKNALNRLLEVTNGEDCDLKIITRSR